MPHRPNHTRPSKSEALLACITIVSGTVLLLSAIDLVLPSIPDLPAIFDTDISTAQMIIASFMAGSACGMLMFGSLATHFGRRRLFITSLFGFTLFSFGALLSPDIWALIGMRFGQGLFSAGSAVLAPGLIRALFSEIGAIRAISAIGSIEALVPGLAPVLGAWLHKHYGWTASFTVTGTLVALICFVALLKPTLLPSIGTKSESGKKSYRQLFKNTTYLRYAMSHAFVLAALLGYVFTAPAVIVKTMGGTIEDFILMQMVGVACFIVFANISGNLVKRFGIERVIMTGTLVCLLGSCALFAYSLLGTNDPKHLKYIFWLLNTGVGLRGGPGFMQALAASNGNDDKASAILLVAITGFSSLATAAIAPFIDYGLPALTFAILLITIPALIIMLVSKPLAATSIPPGE